MKKLIKIGGQFSGVGAFDYAINRVAEKKNFDIQNVYQSDWDKYARISYLANHKEPEYYIKDVHDTPIDEITEKQGSLDIVMFSPPCQSFSLAGKRKGKTDKRGVLFFNSHEFIKKNKPRFFIFENVKGLLSDDNGNTFSEWVNMLGGKSVNGNPILFPYENSVPYHLYYQVLNSKKHGVPQNRERIFLVGIRDDEDNSFQFPKEEPLKIKLKDILEEEIFEKFYLSEKAVDKCLRSTVNSDMLNKEVPDESRCIVAGYYKIPFDGQYLKVKSNLDKYYLSEKMVDGFTKHNENHNEKKTGFIFEPKNENDIANCLRANSALCPTDNTIKIELCKYGFDTCGNFKYDLCDTCDDGDNYEYFERFGQKTIAQTLDVQCNQGVIIDDTNLGFTDVETKDSANCIVATHHKQPTDGEYLKIKSATSKGYETATENDSINFSVPNSKTRRGQVGKGVAQTLDVQCNQGVIIDDTNLGFTNKPVVYDNFSPTLRSERFGLKTITNYRIRRLTPRECFRLQDFPDTFDFSCVSDSQAYKQAGNSITVRVLEKIIDKLKL